MYNEIYLAVQLYLLNGASKVKIINTIASFSEDSRGKKLVVIWHLLNGRKEWQNKITTLKGVVKIQRGRHVGQESRRTAYLVKECM
jgi:hypothetical protein